MLLISYRKEDINENKQYEYSFWYLPGFFVMLLSVVSSVVGLMSSSKVFNGITLFLTIIFFLIFSSPLLLA
ncbi:MAG: hypothetical protein E6429_00110 [Staphylococcus sp.]|nr:hypothetical protein [Staphylococcus sp.]